jgi:hypothetical protein
MVIAVVAAAALVLVVPVAVVYGAVRTITVTVANDGPQPTRLSGCVDDALDLDRDMSRPMEVASDGKTGCNVFVAGQYEGCLILDPRTVQPHESIEVHRGVHREVPQPRCEGLR